MRILRKKVIVGGTFDVLHKGHEFFLRKAFGLGQVTIGLTSDRMAKKAKRRRVSSFQARKGGLGKFLRKSFSKKFKIIKIEDKFGPTLKEYFNYIVVSPATYKTAALINKKRKKVGKGPIKIVKIKFVLAENGKPISAREIIKGRMDKRGKLRKK